MKPLTLVATVGAMLALFVLALLIVSLLQVPAGHSSFGSF